MSGTKQARAVVALLLAITAVRSAAEEVPLFRILQDGKWGFVDRRGAVVITPRFDAAERFSEGLAAVRVGATLGYADRSGALVLVPGYAPAGRGIHRRFSGGVAVIRQGALHGYVDRTGKLVIPARFTWADEFSEGLAYACDARECAYVTPEGRPAITPEFMVGEAFHDGVAVTSAGMSMGRGRVRLLSITHGRLPGEYEGAGRLSEGRIAVQVDGSWGYVDERGLPAIPARYAGAGEFAEGLAPVTGATGRCGYVDRNGQAVIPLRFRACGVFSSGRARVDLAASGGDLERVAFIDRAGEVVFDGASADPPFVRAEDFADGLAAVGVGGDPQLAGTGPLLGYVDPDGRYVWRPTR